MSSPKIEKLYHLLFEQYGSQGWWPLITHEGTNPTSSGVHSGYHQDDFSFPHNRSEQFEICVGAILTQNTAWRNVEMALHQLHEQHILHNPQALVDSSIESLKECIRPAGYFNQKSAYLRNFAKFFISLDTTPTRKELLTVKGIGEETADAMLLYAFATPSFVVDAYTRRFLEFHGILIGGESYRDIQHIFHNELNNEVPLFQDYHALIVEHGKQYFSKKPYGDTL